jgi:hypothetical protein
MTRGKTRRPGTKRPVTGLPDDLPNAAVAALDDMLTGSQTLEAPPRKHPFDTDAMPTVARAVGAPDRSIASAGGAGARKIPPPPPPQKVKRVATAAPLDDEQLVEETVLPKIPTLRFAVYEDGAQLGSAQGAIVASGHVVSAGGSGSSGVPRVIESIRRGGIDVVVVALPGGEAVIDAALALEPRRPVVIAALAGDTTAAIARAIAAGADLVTTRPHDVDRIAPIVLAAVRLHAERSSTVAARGSEQVLRSRLDDIAESEPGGLQPFELFQRALELEIKRARRYEYALSVALFAVEIEPPLPPTGIRGILRARAGNALINSIRDIDLATQLDHERFLVLLPYTDLTGAAGLARRVIGAVGALDPVVSGGRTFPPRVVAAVAGSKPDRELSFAKLMKDATRALEQARRDGAELAVQP